MKIFRSHIIQSIGAGFLLAGMIFYFLKPVNQNGDEDAFTSWLQANLKTGDNAQVIDQIQQLSHSDEELETVIRKASSLVNSHSEDFKLPLSPETNDENEVFHVLLKEWNAYQNTSAGMGEAVIIKQAQPYSVLPVDGIAYTGKMVVQHQVLKPNSTHHVVGEISDATHSYHITPLSGGTAIGAP